MHIVTHAVAANLIYTAGGAQQVRRLDAGEVIEKMRTERPERPESCEGGSGQRDSVGIARVVAGCRVYKYAQRE